LEFKNLVRAGHYFFVIFIGDDYPYLMAIGCAKDWLGKGSFEISDIDVKQVEEHFEEHLQKQDFKNFRNIKDDIEKDNKK